MTCAEQSGQAQLKASNQSLDWEKSPPSQNNQTPSIIPSLASVFTHSAGSFSLQAQISRR